MVSETKSWFFEKIDKVDKPFTGLVMKKKKKKGAGRPRSIKSEVKKGEVTTDTTDIQRSIREPTSNYMSVKWTI